MPSRSNREQRGKPVSHGAPLSTPAPSSTRDKARAERLAKKPTAAERRAAIKALEDSARAEKPADTKTRSPKPTPIRTIGKPGRSTYETIKTRDPDVGKAIDEAEGVEPEKE